MEELVIFLPLPRQTQCVDSGKAAGGFHTRPVPSSTNILFRRVNSSDLDMLDSISSVLTLSTPLAMNASASLTGGSDGLIEAQAAERAQGFTRDSWIFLSLAALITALRTYSRWSMVGFRRFQADDFLVWLALGLYAGETVIDTKLLGQFKGLANDFTNDAERPLLSPDSTEYILRVGASKYRLAEWPIYAMLLWSLKAAMAVFYMRLTESLIGYRSRIYLFFGLMVTTFLIVVAMPFLTCRPIEKMWQINPDPGPLCYPESSPAILYTILGCNIVTDAYLLWIPMPMLFQASLPRASKAVLVCLFGCGLFVTVAATLRIALVAVEVHDFHAIGFWSVRETFVAIATTNMPAIFVLLRRWLRRWLPSSITANDTLTTSLREISAVGGGGGGGGGLFGARNKEAHKSGATLTGFTASSDTKTSKPSPVLSLKRSRTVSSMASQEYMLTSVSTGKGRDDDASIRGGKGDEGRSSSRMSGHHNDVFLGRGRGSESLRRGEGGGIRKQVDIVVVEEALQELGMAVRRAERLERQNAEVDVERDATEKPLPSLPDQVYRW